MKIFKTNDLAIGFSWHLNVVPFYWDKQCQMSYLSSCLLIYFFTQRGSSSIILQNIYFSILIGLYMTKPEGFHCAGIYAFIQRTIYFKQIEYQPWHLDCSNLAWDDLITLQVWVDKENLMEFLFDSVHYLYNYYMVCALLSHTHHVTSFMWHDTVTSWYVTVMCDICYITLSHTSSLCSKFK